MKVNDTIELPEQKVQRKVKSLQVFKQSVPSCEQVHPACLPCCHHRCTESSWGSGCCKPCKSCQASLHHSRGGSSCGTSMQGVWQESSTSWCRHTVSLKGSSNLQ